MVLGALISYCKKELRFFLKRFSIILLYIISIQMYNVIHI